VTLLDASVIVEFLRRRDPRLEQALNELDLAVCGVTRAEVLHGARDETDEQKLMALLDQFDPVATPDETWDKLGRNLCRLRRAGIVVPFTDALLSTIALERDVQLWGIDRHFRLIAGVLPLKLIEAPWT
jgi:predicted nucleic acid-binding protein